MLSDKWEAIKQIFEAAQKLAGPERAKWLDGACHGDLEIRQTVEELLKADNEAGDFLEQELAGEAQPVFQPAELIADRFRITRFISRGGMGEVYEAFDERLSLRVALKTLRFEYAQEHDALERFRREVRVSRDFGHPNLCRVYELVEHRMPGTISGAEPKVITCLTMQLISGETLQQYLAKHGPLTPSEALPLIMQISAAVDVLHSNSIIHRDLKPSNIMITNDGVGGLRAIVMDFGLAKGTRAPKEFFQSRSDFQAGAPFYLAPELLRGERPGTASDIYALGLVVDEMVTTSRPYCGDSVEEILRQKLWGDPISPNKRSRYLPEAWSQAIVRCLSRNQHKRFKKAGDLALALQLDAKEATTSTAIGVTLYAFFARRKALWITLLSVFAAVASLGALIRPEPLNTSVLIFPFENWTGNRDYDFFCRGMTDELTRRLLDLRNLDVIPYYETHSAVPSFKPNTKFSLEGHLQVLQRATRLTVQLNENSTGRVVWMRKFDSSLAQSLEVEDDLAAGAVEAMRSALLGGDRVRDQSESAGALTLIATTLRHVVTPKIDRPGGPATPNAAAMEAYMRGHTLFLDATVPSMKRALEEYKRALSEDPHFALAYSDLSAVDLQLIQFEFTSSHQLLEEARHYAELAVENGSELAEAHTSLAAVYQYERDWAGSAREYKRAIEANPKFARAHRWYGGLLSQFGRHDEALREIRLSIKLDPYDYPGRMTLGTFLLYAGYPQEAADYVQDCLKQKDLFWGHVALGQIYAELGVQAQGKQRLEYLDRALLESKIVAEGDKQANMGDSPGLSTSMFALIYGLRGDRQLAGQYVDRLLVAARSNKVDPEDIACAYVALGDNAAALEVMRRALANKDNGLLFFKVDPFLAPLRSAPEFKTLVAEANFIDP